MPAVEIASDRCPVTSKYKTAAKGRHLHEERRTNNEERSRKNDRKIIKFLLTRKALHGNITTVAARVGIHAENFQKYFKKTFDTKYSAWYTN